MSLEELREKADQLSTEENNVETTPESTTEQPTVESTPDSTPAETQPAPEYQPDFSYKVLDEVKELPEQVRNLIKSKDDEEYWKQVYRKVDGLDHLKSRHEYTKQERDDYRAKFTDINTKVEKLQYFAKNDIGAFLNAAGVTKDQVFDWVTHQLKLQDLPPEERSRYESSQKHIVENYELQQQLEQQQQYTRQLAQNQHELGLQTALSNASDFIKDFDARLGQGAFRNHVQEYGNTIWATQQKYVSPYEAVEAVKEKYKPFFQQQASAQPVVAAAPRSQPATIPSVGKGRSVSHASSSPKNLDDLRALAKSFEGVEDAY